MRPTITETTLRELIKAGSVSSAVLVGQRGGFAVGVSFADSDRFLSTTRGEVRLFANLNTAAHFLSRFGLVKFEVDATEYVPCRLRKARPDRAAALRKTRTTPEQQSLLP